ncbi:enhancer of split mbeta protein-like [Cylas formicarius]|uniref:enhancer of split mbeta protein-like n=1 Tax=Cylas formicarius TaxID=197179 RepID=UPI0029583C31|nr:enhancer of split mbeta protein-like [Cylas formicarius]
MAPTPYLVNSDCGEEPISRTYQYRKVMKPMLERKRRARINRCLDELKELMVTALQSEGENVSKLEKADILELTVRHLHNLKRQHQLILPQEQSYADRFRAGFTQCAQEVTHFITGPLEIVDPMAGRKLLQHLGACVRELDCVAQNYQTQQSNHQHLTPPNSPSSDVIKENNASMWRPW